MLPACRTAGEGFAIPAFDIVPSDVEGFMHEGLLPFKYVVADSLYGNSPDFLHAVDSCVGITTFIAIPSETRCWL
jgi:hypothetical protein